MAHLTMVSLTRTLLILIFFGGIVQKVRVDIPLLSPQPNYSCPVQDRHFAKCAHLNLTSVPQDLPHDLLVLSIYHNHLTELGNRSFMNYNQLEKLLADHNTIAFIDSGTFEPLPRLKVLELEHNLITFLPIYYLQKNALLYIINLSHNKISTISGTSPGDRSKWHPYHHVQTMGDSNILEDIPGYALRGFEKLQVLNVQGNRISRINNESFCGLPALVDLSLSWNRIHSLPHASFACASHLKKIDLSRCRIQQVASGTFANLTTLLQLHLPDNHLTGISKDAYQVLTLGILVYLNRWWINYKLYLLKLAIVGYHEITEDRTPEDYEFQVNLMFYEGDEWWVNDCMKPFLEQRMPHLERIIFGDADLHPGSFYLNAIYDVIENSHKTILLLSNQSVDDTWT
eukprot:XP_011663520.1 PREDICTED: decorin-like [Strongylocentrotus purpuratus]